MGTDRSAILVGGTLVVEDSTNLDSWQPMEEDPRSDVMRRSLGRSRLWWSAVASIVLPILKSAGPRSFALAVGERTVLELDGNQELKQKRLLELLPGGAGRIQSHSKQQFQSGQQRSVKRPHMEGLRVQLT